MVQSSSIFNDIEISFFDNCRNPHPNKVIRVLGAFNAANGDLRMKSGLMRMVF